MDYDSILSASVDAESACKLVMVYSDWATNVFKLDEDERKDAGNACVAWIQAPMYAAVLSSAIEQLHRLTDTLNNVLEVSDDE